MEHPVYGISCKNIDSLDDSNSDGQFYNSYRSVKFLYICNNKDKRDLVVLFHAALSKTDTSPTGLTNLPVFLSYRNKVHNILSISDRLLEDHSELCMSWYSSSKNCDYIQIYREIVQFFLLQYDNVIFKGSSAGGFPALYFAIYFKQIALVFNPQLYLPTFPYYKEFVRMIGERDDNTIEQLCSQYGHPKHAYIYINERDLIHYSGHVLKFKNYVVANGLEMYYSFIEFYGEDVKEPAMHHNIIYPESFDLNSKLTEIFNALNTFFK